MYKTIKNEVFFDEQQAIRKYNYLRDKGCNPVLEWVDYYEDATDSEKITAYELSWEE